LTDNGLLHLLGSDGRSLAFRRVDRSATSLACCDTSAIAVAGMAGITLLGRDLIPLARLAGDTLPTALASVAGQSEPRLLYAAGRMIGEIVYPLWQQGGERTGGLVHDSGG